VDTGKWFERVLQSAAVGVVALALTGCAQEAPPESAVPMNPGDNYVPHQAAPKPLPESAVNPPGQPGPGPYNDEPILQQRLPAEQYFVDAYNKVHQPRIAVYVNRTLTGQVVPPNPGGPVVTEQHTQESTGSVNVSNGNYSEHEDAYGRDVERGHSNFQSNGPAQYTETNTTYLPPSEYDEADVKSLDYDAVERILSDWISCGGRVHMISPDYLTAQLSPADQEALSQGRPVAMTAVLDKLNADVLIQVQAHPTRQANGGLQIRLVAEAMNTRGGDELGNAVVDIPLPLEKTQINDFTRFIAGKLMVSMAGAWDAYSGSPPPPPPPADIAPPARAPLPPVPPPAPAAPATRPTEQMNVIP
jgi:hypothetical protein